MDNKSGCAGHKGTNLISVTCTRRQKCMDNRTYFSIHWSNGTSITVIKSLKFPKAFGAFLNTISGESGKNPDNTGSSLIWANAFDNPFYF